MNREQEILQFISRFDRAQECFMDGCCYWFAVILKERFCGSIVYDPIYGHFLCEIDGDMYDVTGHANVDHSGQFYYWDGYLLQDPLHAASIYRDCVIMR